MSEHPLGVRPAPLGSLHFQNEMEHWLLGPNIDTWQPTGIVPTHNRAITDRLKAAERCVLAIQEALTGEKPDGVLDYDQTREYLLSVIK